MTIQDRLSEAERHIELLQARTNVLEEGQTAHDLLMERMANVLERLGAAYVDITARLDRIDAVLQDHTTVLQQLTAVLRELSTTLQEHSTMLQNHNATLRAQSVDLATIKAILESDNS